ncbi:MAG TPA: hypothetical protein PK478_02000 [Nitrospira sp.]|nr:hypothetical protein [Nitrospira sp.]HQW88589.1 hypothetical protein [Nitrospira sp.]
MSLEIRVDDARLRAALQRAPQVIGAELERTVTGIALDAESGVIAATPVGATGHLRQSITHQVAASALVVQGRVYSTDVPIKVASVEHGRAPGRMPPMAPIELWVSRKLGGDRRVAFLVARAIGRRGTKGQHMFEKGYESATSRLPQRMAGLRAAIARVLS